MPDHLVESLAQRQAFSLRTLQSRSSLALELKQEVSLLLQIQRVFAVGCMVQERIEVFETTRLRLWSISFFILLHSLRYLPELTTRRDGIFRLIAMVEVSQVYSLIIDVQTGNNTSHVVLLNLAWRHSLTEVLELYGGSLFVLFSINLTSCETYSITIPAWRNL